MADVAELLKVMQEQMQLQREQMRQQEERHKQQEERHKQQEERHKQQEVSNEERHKQQLALMQQQMEDTRKAGGTMVPQHQTPHSQLLTPLQSYGRTICYASRRLSTPTLYLMTRRLWCS